MKKVENQKQVYETFQLLGIKDVTTKRQLKNGTQVFELPIKQMYNNLVAKPLRFATYESGYVRNVSEHNSSSYQINKTKKRPADNDYHFESIERILIPKWEERLIYLTKFIIKNYYKKPTYLISDYTISTLKLKNQHDRLRDQTNGLPFDYELETSRTRPDDIKVIINGHRYNLS